MFKALIVVLASSPLFFIVFLGLFAAVANVCLRPRIPVEAAPAREGFTVSDESFLTADGLSLSGWLIGSRTARSRGAVVICHGVGANRDDVLPRARFLAQSGYDCLLFDFRAHGKSQGRTVSFGYHEALDIRAAVDLVLRKCPGKPIAVLAQSMGAATAVLSAKSCPEIQAFVLDSCFTTLWEMTQRNFRTLPPWLRAPLPYVASFFGGIVARAPVWNISPVVVIQDLAPRPALFIHGKADGFIPPEHSRELFERYTGPKDLLLVEGAEHVSSHHTAGRVFEEKVLAFLAKALPAPL